MSKTQSELISLCEDVTIGLVSVIMPAYNAALFLDEAIASVVAQTYENWELLIVDDGSTDETPVIIRRWIERDIRIKLLRTSGRTGVASARSVAISAAKGEFVAFLDSDDVWVPRKLTVQLDFMREHSSVLSFTAYWKMDPMSVFGRGVIEVPATVSYRELLKSNCIGCLTAIYDRRHFGAVSVQKLGVREDYLHCFDFMKGPVVHEDYAFWLGLLSPKGGAEGNSECPIVAHGLNEPLAAYRCGNSSLSSNKLKAAISQWIIYRHIERLSIVESLYYFIHYSLKGALKYRKA
jgi:teichuronic acid biosynthesis glycosyltransferase TuaG